MCYYHTVLTIRYRNRTYWERQLHQINGRSEIENYSFWPHSYKLASLLSVEIIIAVNLRSYEFEQRNCSMYLDNKEVKNNALRYITDYKL